MNAGLPGTGIGGIFYLLSALWMPFHEIPKSFGKQIQPQRMRLIFVQCGIALGIIAGIWLTGWLLGGLRMMVEGGLALTPGTTATSTTGAMPNVIKVTMIFLTIGLLAIVVSGVHILKLVMRYRKARHHFNGQVGPATIRYSQLSLGEMPYSSSAAIETIRPAREVSMMINS
jgi:hypothetical protein